VSGRTIISLGLIGIAATTAKADCLPSVEVGGDAPLSRDVARALAALDVVDADYDSACSAVSATVIADSRGMVVTVRSKSGRIEARVVADATTAAAWIESWVRDDAEVLWSEAPVITGWPSPTLGELAPRAGTALRPTPTVAEVAAMEHAALAGTTPAARLDVPMAVPGARRAWPSLAVRASRDIASDRSSWDGIEVGGCTRIGRVCIGITGRYVVDAAFTNTGGLTAYDRSATVIRATVAVPVALAYVVVSPEITAGVGRTRTVRNEPAETCLLSDGAPCADTPIRIGDGFTATTWAARLGTGVGLAVPLVPWLSLDGRVGIEAAPGAHVDPHRQVATPATDPASVSVSPGDPLLDLPGEPSWAWNVALGLRVEVK